MAGGEFLLTKDPLDDCLGMTATRFCKRSLKMMRSSGKVYKVLYLNLQTGYFAESVWTDSIQDCTMGLVTLEVYLEHLDL